MIVELKYVRVPEYSRRQGIARSLMETGKEYARQFGERTTVFLDVESPNVGAIQSYLSIGFEFDPIK